MIDLYRRHDLFQEAAQFAKASNLRQGREK